MLVVAVVLGALIGGRLAVYHGDPAGLIQFGSDTIKWTQPPHGAPVETPAGYDGQFYWLHATDPLLLHRVTLVDLFHTAPGYHLQRPGYPALAYALALGRRSALPWTMLIVNLLAVLAVTAAAARYAQSLGRSPWWAVIVGLTPGLVLATMRDLSDPLATAAMLGGLIAWQSRRRWPAAILLALAALAREPMILATGAVAVEAVWSCRHQWRRLAAVRFTLAQAAPVVLVPLAAFIGWQLYIHGLPGVAGPAGTGSAAAAAPPAVFPPGHDFVTELRRAWNLHTAAGVWEVVYIALVLAAMVCSLTLLRRGPSAATISAILLSATLTVIIFGDEWGISRYAAPVFATLVASGLRERSRAALLIGAAAAVLTIVIPVTIPGA